MTNRFNLPFQPVISTAPSFNIAVSGALPSTGNALESTAALRKWNTPGSRAVRLVEKSGNDYHVHFGSSSGLAIASTLTMAVLGGTVEIFTPIGPNYSHISIQSSTDVTVNVTLGHGQ